MYKVLPRAGCTSVLHNPADANIHTQYELFFFYWHSFIITTSNIHRKKKSHSYLTSWLVLWGALGLHHPTLNQLEITWLEKRLQGPNKKHSHNTVLNVERKYGKSCAKNSSVENLARMDPKPKKKKREGKSRQEQEQDIMKMWEMLAETC